MTDSDPPRLPTSPFPSTEAMGVVWDGIWDSRIRDDPEFLAYFYSALEMLFALTEWVLFWYLPYTFARLTDHE